MVEDARSPRVVSTRGSPIFATSNRKTRPFRETRSWTASSSAVSALVRARTRCICWDTIGVVSDWRAAICPRRGIAIAIRWRFRCTIACRPRITSTWRPLSGISPGTSSFACQRLHLRLEYKCDHESSRYWIFRHDWFGLGGVSYRARVRRAPACAVRGERVRLSVGPAARAD